MKTERLSTLFAAEVAASIATAEMYDAPLFAEEYLAINRSLRARRREFSAGRAAARAALEKLGLAAMPIPPSADRLPQWPKGYVGSISHCPGLCCSVVASISQIRSLGVDVENAAVLTADLRPLVFDDEEAMLLQAQQLAVGFDLYKVGFSAKEAFYKCYFPVTRQFLEFRDVFLRLTINDNGKSGSYYINVKDKNKYPFAIDKNISGRWLVDEEFVFSGATFLNERI